MEINLDELLLALRELKCSIDEAKNLVYQGKIVPCDRKLQGCQVRCSNILSYVAEIRVKANHEIVDDENNPASGKE